MSGGREAAWTRALGSLNKLKLLTRGKKLEKVAADGIPAGKIRIKTDGSTRRDVWEGGGGATTSKSPVP